ncbi:hypothetical protein SEA_MACGULLY_63 [Rhodococcus phage MacGully]|nr:hypothetical protein SEA_MACGULLY_63 [Rhodococcus phage MacGully]
MRKVEGQELKERLATTLESIGNDADAGKLSADPQAHPFFKVDELPDPEVGQMLSTDDLCSLLAERMSVQGFVVYHDEAVAREHLAKGLSRLGGMLGG